MADVDRAALVELLSRLGSDDDATVLAAARALHRTAAESGLSWDDILQMDRAGTDPAAVDEGGKAATLGPEAGEAARLIDRLLRKDVSDELREELTDMKRQLADGSLDADDRRYIGALAKRLGV